MASITGDTLQEQIQKAISAHGVFKFRLAHMVEAETAEMAPPTAAADYHCPVGKWLIETVPEADRLTAQYRLVADLHSRFHRAAGEVAALSIARRRTEALEAMEPTSTFKKASDQLIRAMEAWAEAIGGGGQAEEAPAEAGAKQPGEPEGAAQAPEPGPPASESEAQGEEPPPGWWRLSPAGMSAEADEVEEEERAEMEQPAEAEAEAETQAPDSDPSGEGDDISDWFGLPGSPGRP